MVVADFVAIVCDGSPELVLVARKRWARVLSAVHWGWVALSF